MAQDYWWLTRPKRKLDPIPEELAAFSAVAITQQWTGNRKQQIAYEEELESGGIKRVGERRDGSGSGGRTHAAMLYSLGLWFEYDNQVFLTLAGEAIMAGKSPLEVLKKQVLRFQYPSAYSKAVKVTSRFRIRPFFVLLRLLSDTRVEYLTQDEIALIVAIQAENETDECYEKVVNQILLYRECGDTIFQTDYLESHGATIGNLRDVANTMMNWIDYTRLVCREEKKKISILPEKIEEVKSILEDFPAPIRADVSADVYQRKYGLDPWHIKDTRNLLNTTTISSKAIDRNRILRLFFNYASVNPVVRITPEIASHISELAGTSTAYAEDVLCRTYPHGALGGYLSNYRTMAFSGTEHATEFEIATTNLFRDVFGYDATHLGQTGALSAPDVLLISDSEGYQAIIDNKAYSRYTISGDHHNRMVFNYLRDIGKYSNSPLPIGFFSYISGGFGNGIDRQILKESEESNVNGSGITADTLISMIQKHTEHPYSHADLRKIFGVNRQILLKDI